MIYQLLKELLALTVALSLVVPVAWFVLVITFPALNGSWMMLAVTLVVAGISASIIISALHLVGRY